jgi:hypothetical protein
MGSFLDSAALTPHGFCLSWTPLLVALHVVSDALIAAAYYSIPVALAVFLLRRRDVAFRWVFWAFALFILACGRRTCLTSSCSGSPTTGRREPSRP